MMAQHPELRALNLVMLSSCRIGMKPADGTVFHGDDVQRRTAPRPLPIKPKSMISPINTTKSPLNEDTPANEATAQQNPSVVVGRNSRPRTGRTGLGTTLPLNGCSRKLLLMNHINTKTRRGASRPIAARRHIALHGR